MPEKHYLRQMQALPLQAKVHMSWNRIREWYEHFDGNVCVSFSGGKDSTVLADLVHYWYPDVPLVFCNTGLEYPEIQEFARKMGAEFVRPKMSFSEVISTYGYPIISKENAEAIYYARRIRNSEGGGYMETSRKRMELRTMRQAARNAANSTAPEYPQLASRTNRMAAGKPHRHTTGHAQKIRGGGYKRQQRIGTHPSCKWPIWVWRKRRLCAGVRMS